MDCREIPERIQILKQEIDGIRRLNECGNPNWGRPVFRHVPYVATAFEEQVHELGLDEETCATSEELKHWCQRN